VTPREKEVLNFVHKYFDKHEFAPTYQEIANGVGIAQPYVSRLVQRLAERGLIAKTTRKSRSVKLLAA